MHSQLLYIIAKKYFFGIRKEDNKPLAKV